MTALGFKVLKPKYDIPLSSCAFNGNGFKLRPYSEATGSIKYDCSRWGRVDIVAYLGKMTLETGTGGKFEIRSVDFEMFIEKGMVRADGSLINWGDNETQPSLGALQGAMRGYMDVPPAGNHHRHALAVPAADSEGSSDDQSLLDVLGSTGRKLLGDSTKYDSCEATQSKELIYLDRKRFYCQGGRVMRSWGSTYSGCSNYDQRGYATCADEDRESRAVQCGAQSYHKTTLQEFGNEVYYLDRHKVRCPSDTFLTGWKLQRSGRNKAYISFQCCSTYPLGAVKIHRGSCANAVDLQDMQYHRPRCPTGMGMVGFSFSRCANNGRVGRMYADAYCSIIPITPSPPPSPFPPPAPPPPSPPPDDAYYNISGKISGIIQVEVSKDFDSSDDGEATDSNLATQTSATSLKIMASIYFDIPRKLYSIAVRVTYLSEALDLLVEGRVDLDLSNPEAPKYCDASLDGSMRLKLFEDDPGDCVMRTDGSNTTDCNKGGISLAVSAASHCPGQDGISKYSLDAQARDWDLLGGKISGDLLRVHGIVWKYGECTPERPVKEGETDNTFAFSNFPGVLLAYTKDVRQVRLFSATAGGEAIDPYYPSRCGEILPDPRAGKESTSNVSYYIFTSCQPHNFRTIALKMNLLEGAAYLQAVDALDWGTKVGGYISDSSGVYDHSYATSAADMWPTLEELFSQQTVRRAKAIPIALDADQAGIGLKHIKWETFTTTDCSALGSVPGSTDMYWEVEAKDVALSEWSLFSRGNLFSMSASMFANVTTFDRNELTLEFLTLVLSLDMAVGEDLDKPLLALGGTLNYTYPCKRGMDITGTNVRGEMNIGSFRVAGTVNITYPCEAQVEDRQLKLVGYIAELAIKGQRIYEVSYDIAVWFDPEKLPANKTHTSNLTAEEFRSAIALRGWISGKASLGEGTGASLGADITFIFDSLTGKISIAATITFDCEYLSAVIKGAYTNDCEDVTQFDFITGNATIDVNSVVMGKGTISGDRFCHPRAPTRYNIAVHSEYFIIEPVPGMRLEVKGDVTAVGMASEEETLKDDELTWMIAGNLAIDINMEGGGGLPFPADELRLIDSTVDFTATFNKDAGVTDITIAVDGAFRFASGTDPASPFVKMSGDFKFNYPCLYGDSVVLANIKGAVNVGSFAVSLGNSDATFFCLPKVGDILFDIAVAVDLVKLDKMEILDVKVAGVGIIKEGGGTDFTGSVAGKMKVEGFKIEVFLLVNSATKSVKPTIKISYEADGLSMELFFATSLKDGMITCRDPTTIYGSLEVNVAGGSDGEDNKFKANVNGYYDCSDANEGPMIYLDAVATAALPFAGIFVNHAHVRLEGFDRTLKVTAHTTDEVNRMMEDSAAEAHRAEEQRAADKVPTICHMGGVLYQKPDGTEPIGVYSHPGVRCDPKLVTTDFELEENATNPSVSIQRTEEDDDRSLSPRVMFSTDEGGCCNANNAASVELFSADKALCCRLGTMNLEVGTRCTASRWCNDAGSCIKAAEVPSSEMCPDVKTNRASALGRARFGGRFGPGGISAAASAQLGAVSAAEQMIAHTGSERTYCHLDKKLYGMSDLGVYGTYPVPKCFPHPPTAIAYDIKPDDVDVKTVPIEGILDNVFFRGYFFGEAEIQNSLDVGIPGNADVTATVAVGFTAMNPPLDFTLEDMNINASFRMELKDVFALTGAAHFRYPTTVPMTAHGSLDFLFDAGDLTLPALDATVTIFPLGVNMTVSKGRAAKGFMSSQSPFMFKYPGIDVEVKTMFASFELMTSGAIEGTFTAEPSVAISTGGADVSVDMVIMGRWSMNPGEPFQLAITAEAKATLDVESEYFKLHLTGGASTECKHAGTTLSGTFWIGVPGMKHAEINGIVDVVKRCGAHFGDDVAGATRAIPMIEGRVGVPSWKLGDKFEIKDVFVNFVADPGEYGDAADVSDYSWSGDFTGTVDVDGGIVPKSISTFGEVSVKASMDWGYNKTFGLHIGQVDVEVQGKFVIGTASSEIVRLELDARFKAPCKPSDVIEANALLFVHATGNSDHRQPVPLSIAGASVAIYIPCNMDPQPKDIVMMIAERSPVTVVTPIASLEITIIDFKVYGDKSMSGTLKAKPVDITTMEMGTGMFGGLVTFDTTAESLYIDADYAWVDDMISIRAKGSFGINESATCDLGGWTLEGTARIIPTSGSIKEILAEVYVTHECDGSKEVYNITGNVSPFDIPEIGLQVTQGRIEVNGLTNDTGLVPHMAWNGTVVGSASINTESAENTLPALGSADAEIRATTRFNVVGKKLAFTYFGANATFRYTIGDTSSDTWMELSGSVEMALPCTPGMVGKGKGVFKARMMAFKWDMVAHVTVYCGNTGTEDPVISISAKTVGEVQLTDSIKFDKLSIDAQAYHLDSGKYAVKGSLAGLSNGVNSIFMFDTRTGEISAAARLTFKIPDWFTATGSVAVKKGRDDDACSNVQLDVTLAADIRTPVINANVSIIGSYRACGARTVYALKTYPSFQASLDSSDDMHLMVKNVILELKGSRPEGMALDLSSPGFDSLVWNMKGSGMVSLEAGRLLPTHLDGSAEFDMTYSPTHIFDGVERPGSFKVNYVKVTLHMSFTAGPRDNPNVYVIGSTSFKYPAGNGAVLSVEGTVQLAFKDVCDISMDMQATAFVGASGNEPVFAFAAQNVGTTTIKGITVTDFKVRANVYVHIGASPGYAVAGTMQATASVGSASASEAAALGLGISAQGSIGLAFNTRYSLQMSMLVDFVVDFDKMKIQAKVGVSVGSCPHEGNFIDGKVTLALSPTVDYVQDFSGTVLCDPAEDLNVANPDRKMNVCPMSWYPKISDAIDTLTLLNTSANVTDETEDNLKDMHIWTGGGEVPANCTLPRVYIKTAIAGEITVGPVKLARAYADIYGWGVTEEPGDMTWAGEFFATIEIDNPFPGREPYTRLFTSTRAKLYYWSFYVTELCR